MSTEAIYAELAGSEGASQDHLHLAETQGREESGEAASGKKKEKKKGGGGRLWVCPDQRLLA